MESWTVDEILRFEVVRAARCAKEAWLAAAMMFVREPSNDIEERSAVYERVIEVKEVVL